MTNIEQLKRRLEKIELVNHPNERLSEEFIRDAVNRVLEQVGNEILPSGLPFWQGSPQEQKEHNKKWLDEHPEGADDGINVEREARKLAHLLPLIQGVVR